MLTFSCMMCRGAVQRNLHSSHENVIYLFFMGGGDTVWLWIFWGTAPFIFSLCLEWATILRQKKYHSSDFIEARWKIGKIDVTRFEFLVLVNQVTKFPLRGTGRGNPTWFHPIFRLRNQPIKLGYRLAGLLSDWLTWPNNVMVLEKTQFESPNSL